MIAESPTVVSGDQSVPNDYRRLFFAQVGAVVVTAVLVAPLLLGVSCIPSWLSAVYCFFIATVAIAFIPTALNSVRRDRGISAPNRIECMALTVGLSIVQIIFILPVLICIYMPTLRL